MRSDPLRIQLDAGTGGQLDDGVLREVLAAHAEVGGPLVLHGVGAQVNGSESQLGDPALHILVLVHIAHGLGGAHGQTHDVALVQTNGASQSGHDADVGNDTGHIADLGGSPVVHGLDLVPAAAGHLVEDAGDHGSVADEGAGAGYADGVHPGHLGGGGLQGFYDAVELVGGILVQLGIPDHFLGVDALAVDHSGNFAVGSACVKADAAAVQMTADGHGLLVGLGAGIQGQIYDLQMLFVQLEEEVVVKGALAVFLLVGLGAGIQGQIYDLQMLFVQLEEEVVVKGALAVFGVSVLQLLGDVRAAADGHPEATDGPQQELHIPLHIAVVRLCHFGGAVDEGAVDGDLALIPLNGDGKGLVRALEVCFGPYAEGDETGVEDGDVLHFVVNA